MRAAVKRFIVDRLLSEPRLKNKYTGGKCNIPSGRFERRYKKELNDHILKMLLVLVVFLDGAKLNDVIGYPVRLFNRSGIVKSSKAFLHVLCRDYIDGIGNLPRYLSQKEVEVYCEQNPLEELEFSVSNLAVDLRDGVRLGKLAELLGKCRPNEILEQMRLPAISRLQKVHNVSISLSALAALNLPSLDQIHPNYIVDGHRPQVLKMLWSIVTSFKLKTILKKEEVREDIYSVNCSNKLRHEAIQFSPICGDIERCDDICDLILALCQAVCICYGYKVNNFSTSFADGRAICLLVHHYLPKLIKLSDILPTCTTVHGSSNKAHLPTYLIQNERNNCILACEKIMEIGGIPNMFPISNTVNVPDERSTIICVAYLFARLFESRKDFRAATVIQMAYAKYYHRREQNHESNLFRRTSQKETTRDNSKQIITPALGLLTLELSPTHSLYFEHDVQSQDGNTADAICKESKEAPFSTTQPHQSITRDGIEQDIASIQNVQKISIRDYIDNAEGCITKTCEPKEQMLVKAHSRMKEQRCKVRMLSAVTFCQVRT